MIVETVEVKVEAHTDEAKKKLEDVKSLANGFGKELSSALKDAVVDGKSLNGVLDGLVNSLSQSALNKTLQPLETNISGTFGNLLTAAFGGGASVVAPQNIVPFAKGGVLGGPALFGLGGENLGLAGEAGAEAIMPLARGSDGRLGVQASAGKAPVQITMNVSTQDAQSFQRSRGRIASDLARAVDQGRRNQ